MGIFYFFIMRIKLLNFISILGFLTVLKFWIEELHLTKKAEKVLLAKEGWLTKEHLDAAFGLLYNNILKYVGFQEHVARTDNDLAKHVAPVNRPCLQFYHIDRHGHWILLYFFLLNESHYQCYVYDTFGFHDLDFEQLQHIGISSNIRIQQGHPYQQEDGFSCGPLVVAMAIDIAYQLNSGESIYNMVEIRKHLWNCFRNKKIIPFPKVEFQN